MKDLGKIMQQAKELQDKMAEMQAQLNTLEVQGVSGGGMVTVTMNGKGELKAVKIDTSLLKADEGEILEDLIVAAAGDAKTQAEERAAEEMSKLTGGLPLPPGMKLPF